MQEEWQGAQDKRRGKMHQDKGQKTQGREKSVQGKGQRAPR